MLTCSGTDRAAETGTPGCHRWYSLPLPPLLSATAPVSDDNLLEWKGTILGPQNTPYKVLVPQALIFTLPIPPS